MRVTILRGISGSGKSTWAQTHAAEATIVSTDSHFLQPDGSYLFDATKLQAFHRRTFRTFLEAVLRQEPWIIVDNTNIRLFEFMPYLVAAEAYDYTVEVITFSCTPETALARKQLVAPWKVYQKHVDLQEEIAHFPRYVKEIHRVISTD